jgi:O-methyltransferase involved in polyketide biosynthesis
VRFVALDLADTSLADMAFPAAATWNWLGVTMYLESTANQATLRAIAARGHGTTLVTNFLLARDDMDDFGRVVNSTATAVAAADGEPVLATYRLSEIDPMLRSAGFERVELLTAASLAQRYIDESSRVKLPGSTIIAIATT